MQSVELRSKTQGPEHPDTLKSMHSYGVALSKQRRHEEAERVKLQCYELRSKVLGAEHPDTLTSLNNLAHTLAEQGCHKQAEGMKRKVSNGFSPLHFSEKGVSDLLLLFQTYFRLCLLGTGFIYLVSSSRKLLHRFWSFEQKSLVLNTHTRLPVSAVSPSHLEIKQKSRRRQPF